MQKHRRVYVGESDASPCNIRRQTTGRMVTADELSFAAELTDRAAHQVHGHIRQLSRRCDSATSQTSKVQTTITQTSGCSEPHKFSLVTT